MEKCSKLSEKTTTTKTNKTKKPEIRFSGL